MAKILIVDDDELLSDLLARRLRASGHLIERAETLGAARTCLGRDPYDLVLLDVNLPDGNGLDFLPRIQETTGMPEVIIITGQGDPDGAEVAIRSGAWDYVQKGGSLSSVLLPVTRALQHRELKKSHDPLLLMQRGGIIGDSAPVRSCLVQAYKAALSDISVLISGETGTGKELAAWCVHTNSTRANGSFVVVDCAALPENLVESLLFGHVKGAFTGADKDRDGLIRQADGGTLFLDEVGELPLALQKAFLRALQEHRFRPVGSEKEIESDFRLVAATNRDLDQMVQAGQFRKDLLFRVRSVVIDLPPLRERQDDVRLLAEHFLERLSTRHGAPRRSMSDEYLTALKAYDWPGNVRELLSCIERSVAAAGTLSILEPHHLPQGIRVSALRSRLRPATPTLKEAPIESPEKPEVSVTGDLPFPSLDRVRADSDRRYLQSLMDHCHGEIREACNLSGLSRSRLYALLNKHKVSNPSE